MKNLIESSKVIIFIGNGGVGKTTLSATYALWAAQRGKKVLVLTIDPSKRLAKTLGLDERAEVSQIGYPNMSGELFASVVDPSQTFDRFLERATSYSDALKKLKNNKLFVQLKTNLSDSQDFTALERLYSEYESQKYDLIILDTPPSHHIHQFLKSPQKLAELFSKDVIKWFTQGESNFLVKVLRSGFQQALKILESLTGAQFIAELVDFFKNAALWQEKIEQRVSLIHNFLHSQNCQYVLVSAPSSDKINESKKIIKELHKEGIKIKKLLINRSYNLNTITRLQNPQTKIERLNNQYFDLVQQSNDEIEKLKKEMDSDTSLAKIPSLVQPINDIHGISLLVEYLKNEQN